MRRITQGFAPRAQAAAAPSRLRKSFPTEGGIGVPFFAAGPGFEGGTTSHALATAMDVPITMLEMAGLSLPPPYEKRAVAPPRGRSMATHLAGRAAPVHAEGAETGREPFGRRAIRRGNWKVPRLRAPEGIAAWQRYDLELDPGETRDRAADPPEILDEPIEAWRRHVAQLGVVKAAISLFEIDPL